MARLGLGSNWRCLLANDICPKKISAYRSVFKDEPEPICCDIADLDTHDLPEGAFLSWASFPCQDLSLAGKGLGLNGKRSGTFWPFWQKMIALNNEGRPTPLIVLENVAGALVSREGRDFIAIAEAMADLNYCFGAVIIDSVLFLPQSRPRLFIIAVKSNCFLSEDLSLEGPRLPWHPRQVASAYKALPKSLRDNFVWWNILNPPHIRHSLLDTIEDPPQGIRWHSEAETKRLLSMMSEVNLAKVKSVQSSGQVTVGTIYKRTRRDSSGRKIQRAEVRFDQISGCLRTPAGGSSRQIVLIVHGDTMRSRLITARETARLMGVDDNYPLPKRYNDAYHLFGDGVAVPVVSWLEQNLLRHLARSQHFFEAA